LYIAIQNFLNPFFQDFVCVRGNFISAGLANMLLVAVISGSYQWRLSVADVNEVLLFVVIYIFLSTFIQRVTSALLYPRRMLFYWPEIDQWRINSAHTATDDFLVWSRAFRAKSPDFYPL
jgi:hypothetical protein